jgi:transposase
VHLQQVRPKPELEPVMRFETEPGHQAQVDYAEVKLPWGKRYVLLVVLGYSRLLWLRVYDRPDMRALIDGLEEAFRFFGGVPQEVLFDQMKSVITRDLLDQGERLIENAEFLRFAAHWGFRIRACRPYRALTNAVAVSFFATLEKELIEDADWHTRAEARQAIFDFIEIWYNRERRHSSLGYRTPAEFEQQAALSKAA